MGNASERQLTFLLGKELITKGPCCGGSEDPLTPGPASFLLVEVWDEDLRLRPAYEGHWGEKLREIEAQVALSCLQDVHTKKPNYGEKLKTRM